MLKLFAVIRTDSRDDMPGFETAVVLAGSKEDVIPTMRKCYPPEFDSMWGHYKHLLINELPGNMPTVIADDFID